LTPADLFSLLLQAVSALFSGEWSTSSQQLRMFIRRLRYVIVTKPTLMLSAVGLAGSKYDGFCI
jgi:hypothetical protein